MPGRILFGVARQVVLRSITLHPAIHPPTLKELLRFREMLGELYLNVSKEDPTFMMMYRTLMNWNGCTSRVEL